MTSFRKIGLTGGIGSGKSEAAKLFSENGIRVVDLDKVGKELTDSDPSVQTAIVSLFGPEILKNGLIDRARVRALVFADPHLKKKLEQIIQPKVRKVFEELCESWRKTGHNLIICEAALLIESGYRQTLDELIVVMASPEVRLQRILQRDKISPVLAQQMLNAQVTDSDRLKAATYLLKNEKDLSELRTQVNALVQKWKQEGLV